MYRNVDHKTYYIPHFKICRCKHHTSLCSVEGPPHTSQEIQQDSNHSTQSPAVICYHKSGQRHESNTWMRGNYFFLRPWWLNHICEKGTSGYQGIKFETQLKETYPLKLSLFLKLLPHLKTPFPENCSIYNTLKVDTCSSNNKGTNLWD